MTINLTQRLDALGAAVADEVATSRRLAAEIDQRLFPSGLARGTSAADLLTDYQRGRLDGLRVAATFCLDYGHFSSAPEAEVRRVATIYNHLGRLIAAADCDACNMYGSPNPDGGRDDRPCEHPGVEREFRPIEVQL